MKKLVKILGVSLCLLGPVSANAEQIGKVTTSGLLFKDSIVINSFNDPTLEGVTCHVSNPKRSLSFEDQTNSSIACRQTGEIKGNYKVPAMNLFSQSKGLFFKKMRVDRFWDSKNKTLVYIAYTKKVRGDNASHSLSTVPLYRGK